MPPQCCKAGRVAAQYGFDDNLEEDLGAQWEADNGPGLRKLADQFNVRVVKDALVDASEPFLNGEPELLYELLAGDDVREAERSRVERRLEAMGIDPGELTDDFISHRTIDRHFKSCTDRQRESTSDAVDADQVRDRIAALKHRLEQVTEKSIAEVHGGEQDRSVMVQVNVVCSGCNQRRSAREFIEHGCECNEDAESRRAEMQSTVE